MELIKEYQERKNHAKSKQNIKEFEKMNSLAYQIMLNHYYPQEYNSDKAQILLDSNANIKALEEIFDASEVFKKATINFFNVEPELQLSSFTYFYHHWFKQFYIG